MSTGGGRPAPTSSSQVAWFPFVTSAPNASPKQILFPIGANSALVEVELLDEVHGITLCLQRSLSTPVSVEAWSGCTYHYSASLVGHSALYSFNATEFEGNVPYYVNLVLQGGAGEPVQTTSANIYVTVDLCALGYTRAIHHPDQCVAVNTLADGENAVMNMTQGEHQQVFYFSVNAPNNRVDQLVTAMDVQLSIPQRLDWAFYSSANMPAMFDSYDFTANSNQPEYASGKLRINTPSPGVWFFAVILTSQPNYPAYIATISRNIIYQSPAALGTEIPANHKVLIGPTSNTPGTLKHFFMDSPDGSLYVSLSTLHPRQEKGTPPPYKLFVAVNAVPGAFNDSISSQGSNVFADWTGCSLPPANCSVATIIQLPPSGRAATYVLSILPVGAFQGTQFAIWRDSICPYCERGICQATPDAWGTCKCPKGWKQIDCAKWGEKYLTPQTIVIIAVMAFFALFGIGCLIYVIYTKRAKLFPNKYGKKAQGYDSLIQSEEDPLVN